LQHRTARCNIARRVATSRGADRPAVGEVAARAPVLLLLRHALARLYPPVRRGRGRVGKPAGLRL
jgi:hypothetical protein